MFYPKSKIINFQRPPILGLSQAPGVASDQKVAWQKMFLEHDCRGMHFMQKMPNSKKLFFGGYPPIQTQIFWALP